MEVLFIIRERLQNNVIYHALGGGRKHEIKKPNGGEYINLFSFHQNKNRIGGGEK